MTLRISFAATAITLGTLGACGKSVEVSNQRTVVPNTAAAGEAGSGDRDSDNPDSTKSPVVEYAALDLIEAPNADRLASGFVAGLLAINKVAENKIVLFGPEGKSWVYNPGDNLPPTALDPVVVAPQGSTLYTLPDGEFCLVSQTEVGKRKASPAQDSGLITVERFSTSRFDGNKAEIKALYASKSDLILNLSTHLVILSIRGGEAAFSQFALDKLPVKLNGPILAAGQAKDGAYWLASKDQLALLVPKGLSFSWSEIKVPLNGREHYKMLGLWLDQGAKNVLGDAVMLVDDKIWSVSGAPIAAPAPVP